MYATTTYSDGSCHRSIRAKVRTIYTPSEYAFELKHNDGMDDEDTEIKFIILVNGNRGYNQHTIFCLLQVVRIPFAVAANLLYFC